MRTEGNRGYSSSSSSSCVLAVVCCVCCVCGLRVFSVHIGYDMIDDVESANDGDGRDADASDPGNRLPPKRSSWHGTIMAGIIAAATNNEKGIAGVAGNAQLLPVRTQGVGGGHLSNVIDGLRWAAGLSVVGVPHNPTPAQVINLSIGGRGACSGFLQSAVDDAVARGVVVVASAGNDNSLAWQKPCNCANAICVGGHDRNGARASYSNFGAAVDIMAPGGDRVGGQLTPAGLVVSTTNAGRNAPGEDLCPSDVSVWEERFRQLPGPCDGVTFRIRRGRGAHMPPYSDDVATSDASGMPLRLYASKHGSLLLRLRPLFHVYNCRPGACGMILDTASCAVYIGHS